MTRDEAVRLADDRATLEGVPVWVYEDRNGFLVSANDDKAQTTSGTVACVYTAWPPKVAA